MSRTETLTDLSEERQPSEAPELSIDEVRELVAEGREQGYLNNEHIMDVLQDVDLRLCSSSRSLLLSA